MIQHTNDNAIIHNIVTWYKQNHQLFPWRMNVSPYTVWISEVMLQQTTVHSVIPYFTAFMDRFPTLTHLAHASIDDVLSQWQGLGYYRRAHHMHKAAQEIMLTHQGIFPSSWDDIGALPGVGPYTQSAIASIALGHPVIPVDGNVYRVLSRLFALSQTKQELTVSLKPFIQNLERALAKYPMDHNTTTLSAPSAYAQGLMDLGRTVCTPKSPACSTCPLNAQCMVYKAQENPELYPRPMLKTARPTKYAATWIVEKDDSIYLEKRHERGLLSGLWQCPTTPFLDQEDDLHAYDLSYPYLGYVEHIFSHFKLIMRVYLGCSHHHTAANTGIWTTKEALPQYGLSTLMKKCLSLCSSLN